ncbi:accessory gene regulator ArgB-like protein [Paenibacillus sp. GCM10012303]|uniref:accessory gene regulator ArgB-like protein n=1 Tax=Paenibacillus sp. GCM10012303 TaxID=3317340 RepID=UPI00361E9E0C
MIERLAKQLAVSIKTANPERTSSVEVMKFSLIILLNALSIIILTMSIGMITGVFNEAVIVIIGFALLRFFSGGLHLPTSEWCIAASTAVLVVVAHLPIYGYTSWVTLASLVLVVLFAPARVEEHHRIAQTKTMLFKAVAILIVASNFFWSSDALAKALLVQSLLVLPIKRR